MWIDEIVVSIADTTAQQVSLYGPKIFCRQLALQTNWLKGIWIGIRHNKFSLDLIDIFQFD